MRRYPHTEILHAGDYASHDPTIFYLSVDLDEA